MEVDEGDPHPDHQLRKHEILRSLLATEWVRIHVLRIAETFSVVEDKGNFLEVDCSHCPILAVDLHSMVNTEASTANGPLLNCK